MSDANAFAASPAGIADGAQIAGQIAREGKSVQDDFGTEANKDKGWQGTDSFGRQLTPQLAGEFQMVDGGLGALVAAFAGIADSSNSTGKSVQGTQDDAYEYLQQFSPGGADIDGINGRH